MHRPGPLPLLLCFRSIRTCPDIRSRRQFWILGPKRIFFGDPKHITGKQLEPKGDKTGPRSGSGSASGEESMWFPHRMCRRRSHALTLFSQQRKPSPRRKRLFLVTRAISPRHQQPAAPGGGAPGGGGARAREFRDSQGQGAPKPA
jgi:hypothetical protein